MILTLQFTYSQENPLKSKKLSLIKLDLFDASGEINRHRLVFRLKARNFY